MRAGLARRLLLVASVGLLVVGNPLPEAMVPPGLLLLQGAAASSLQVPAPDDQSARSERSANLSHITGTFRKLRMFIKNRYLQLMPDGQVNGTNDQLSDYTILQRSSVKAGQLKIQGVATCMHLCMDACGLLYGSREFNDECVFNEMINDIYYNTYSSAKYSNQRRTFYLALNNKGQSRRVCVKAKIPLGKLSTYTRVLPQWMTPSEQNKVYKCPPPAPEGSEPDMTPRCKRPRRKKKKRRRCPENKKPCKIIDENGNLSNEEEGCCEEIKKNPVIRRKCEEESCRTKKLMIGRKRKSRHGARAQILLTQSGEGIQNQNQNNHDGVNHPIKRTRHLHHLRHRGVPDVILDQDLDDDISLDNDDDHDDNEDHNTNNNNSNNHHILVTTIDPNIEDNEDMATDHLVQFLDTNDKKK